ncbi:hypothetical protein T10_6025 [Trichinella papuae]|uniref:Uncharacterized protein n=1 Tax=Trichinella papuae TaxID=268474 RepID=A0A0V1LY90_9BILA|nr:hypothetical protein T10_6025 [Trichinella papuae]
MDFHHLRWLGSHVQCNPSNSCTNDRQIIQPFFFPQMNPKLSSTRHGT